MKTVTIYNKYKDESGREVYQRSLVSIIHRYGAKSIVIAGKAVETTDHMTFYVSMNSYQSDRKYEVPDTWQAGSETFTFRKGDYIYDGVCDAPDKSIAKEILQSGALQITSVNTLDYGSAHMRHWKLEAE